MAKAKVAHRPGKPGRKKNPKYIILSLKLTNAVTYNPDSSAAARRDQNRIAQREFRLRKQQRVSVNGHYEMRAVLNIDFSTRFAIWRPA